MALLKSFVWARISRENSIMSVSRLFLSRCFEDTRVENNWELISFSSIFPSLFESKNFKSNPFSFAFDKAFELERINCSRLIPSFGKKEIPQVRLIL